MKTLVYVHVKMACQEITVNFLLVQIIVANMEIVLTVNVNVHLDILVSVFTLFIVFSITVFPQGYDCSISISRSYWSLINASSNIGMGLLSPLNNYFN